MCDFDVKEAFYAVQRKNLSELYKYLVSVKHTLDEPDSESKKMEEKGKTDMDAMKDKVLEKTKDEENDKESYEVRVWYSSEGSCVAVKGPV